MGKFIDLTGHRFGRWTVLSRDTTHKGQGTRWQVQCDCGRVKSVLVGSLRFGHSLSCGCRRRELTIERFATHGHSNRSEYNIYRNIRGRCCRRTNPGYSDYGARGITVCSRWLSNYELFIEDMGHRPSLKHSVDRIDVNKGYWCGKPECPECGPLGREPNCRWATTAEQANNRQGSRKYLDQYQDHVKLALVASLLLQHLLTPSPPSSEG